MDHFYRPRNQRCLEHPDAVGVAGAPGNGPFMAIYLRFDPADPQRIAEASFQTHGCAPSVAAGSLLCERLPGSTRAEARSRWTEPEIDRAIGGLPPHKRHCSALAAGALSSALAAAPRPEDSIPVKGETTWS